MRVVIVGSGIAGIEGLLGLRALAGERVDVELVSPAENFHYRPMLVAEPFGAAGVTTVPLERICAQTSASHRRTSATAFHTDRHEIETDDGDRLTYDSLLVTLGAQPVPAVPGAVTFGDAAGREEFERKLQALGRRSLQRLGFVVPKGSTWSIAAYELALLTAAERDARGLGRAQIVLVTHEDQPLQIFGDEASATVRRRLEEAGIEIHLGASASRFGDHTLELEDGAAIPLDSAISLPRLEVPPLSGLPQREHGFIQTDVAMHVAGLEDVWAAGDATWFPIKQGGLAAQQADVAIRSIAARAGARVPSEPFQPILRGILITGGSPEFLRSSLVTHGSEASDEALWAPRTKVAGRYLGPFLAGILGAAGGEFEDRAAGSRGEGREERERAVALLLAAADADAGHGDIAGAVGWLDVVERLDLVIPSEYVARRERWQRMLDPDGQRSGAAERIDPSLRSTEAALNDLRRRISWLREVELRNAGEMRGQLKHFDEDLRHLEQLSRQTGALRSTRRAGEPGETDFV